MPPVLDSGGMVSSAPTAQVAGYSIVRVLARDPRATLLLAQHDGQPCVLRIVAEEYDAARLDREIDARARAAHEHAATVLDLATSDTGAPVVVLEHLSGPRLDELLDRRRGDLSAGEAVTLIVPLLEAVTTAHDRGLTFGGLAVDGIRLRSDGAPVITRFSAARAGAVLGLSPRSSRATSRLRRATRSWRCSRATRRQISPPGSGPPSLRSSTAQSPRRCAPLRAPRALAIPMCATAESCTRRVPATAACGNRVRSPRGRLLSVTLRRHQARVGSPHYYDVWHSLTPSRTPSSPLRRVSWRSALPCERGLSPA